MTLVNDLGSAELPLSLENITLGGEGSIRLSGNPVSPSTAKNGTFFLTDCGGDGAITDFDIVFPNHDLATTIWLYTANTTSWTHNGRISAAGNTIVGLKVDHGTANHGQKFYGDISMENGSVDARGGWTDALFDFYGRLSVKDFNRNLRSGTGPNGIVTFHNPSNEFTSVGVTRSGIKANAPGALGNGAELVGGYNQGSYFDIGVYDQTVWKISTPISSDTAGLSNSGHYITGSGSTLMIAATESFTCDFKYQGSVNVVWNPSGDCTYTGTERTHATSGKIAVKRGTMAFKGATTFSNLAEIEIAAGAKFSLAEVTTASPLPAIKTIWLENGTTCKFALPENSSVANVSVFTGGVPLAAGTYTGEGGTADHVVDWIEGRGIVTVVAPTERYFTGANGSTRWADALNWSNYTLPQNDIETVVAVPGVTVPSGDDVIYDLASFPSANNATTPTFTVRRGGGVTVSGGSLVITNITGKARLGGDDASVTSRIDVTSGYLGLYAKRHDSFAIGKGGVLAMTGGRAEYYYPHGNNSSREWMFRMVDGGMLDLSGNADFVTFMSGNPALVFGTGAVDVRENAQLSLKPPSGASPRSWWSPNAADETLTVSLSGNSRMISGCEDDNICGVYSGAKSLVKVSGNAALGLGNSVYIGAGNTGAYGEIDISGCAVVSNRYYAVYVGSKGKEGAISNGKIKMSGGTLQTKAANSGDARGLLVGYDSSTSFADFYNYGTLDISDGTVNNNTSANCGLVVGRGNSYGEVLQSGGTFNQGSKAARVGWYGGTGLYRFTGGTADFSKCDFNVGANDGKGTLEIGAGSGTFTSKNLNLAGSGATLKFKPGANGSLAALGVTGTFTVASGAKLVVDASEYTGNEPVNLMTFASKSGEFAVEDVEIVAAKPSRFKVVQDSGSIQLTVPQRGFMLLVR